MQVCSCLIIRTLRNNRAGLLLYGNCTDEVDVYYLTGASASSITFEER